MKIVIKNKGKGHNVKVGRDSLYLSEGEERIVDEINPEDLERLKEDKDIQVNVNMHRITG